MNKLPIVFHIPHASIHITDDVKSQFIIDELALQMINLK